MCRWLAYNGNPIRMHALLFEPEHSLIDQSLSARMSATTTNGDGFGLGWYDPDGRPPGMFKDLRPAWNDANLGDLTSHVRSGLFFAHVRATTGTAVQRSNCHPFRHDRWLFMHNGEIRGFQSLKRDLAFQVAPELYPCIEGTTDSELMFYLALTFGLELDPPTAVSRMVALVEKTADKHGVESAMQMSLCITDGSRMWAFRYATSEEPRTVYFSDSMAALRELNPRLKDFSEQTRAVVSEPFGDMSEAWIELPAGSFLRIEQGTAEIDSFAPAGSA